MRGYTLYSTPHGGSVIPHTRAIALRNRSAQERADEIDHVHDEAEKVDEGVNAVEFVHMRQAWTASWRL